MTPVLDLMNNAALLLGSSGRLIHANPAARSLLREDDGLTITGDGDLHVATAAPAETRALAKRIGEALAVAAGGEGTLSPPLVLTRPSGRASLLVTVVPLPPPAFAPWTDRLEARVLLLVSDPEAPSLAAARALGAAVGLTQGEVRVVALIGGGLSTPQAAEALGVSAATVKTQLAHAYDKLGLRSQVALAKLLTSLPRAGFEEGQAGPSRAAKPRRRQCSSASPGVAGNVPSPSPAEDRSARI